MSRRTLVLFVILLAGLALLVPAGSGRSQAQAEQQPAEIHVYLPDSAQLTFDGARTQQSGSMRRFVSPPLPAGQSFVYKLKASWKKQGQPVVQEKEIRVVAGKTVDVEFRADDDKKADQKKSDLNREPDVVYWPTPQNVVDKMLELAEVKKGDVVYDLGCGDARILVTAAKKYGVKGLGVDIDPARIKDSNENVKKNKVEELITIKRGDIFEMDLTPASVVTLYLLPELNVKLMPQLAKLKPGTRIVSHDFDMKGAKPKQVVKIQATNHMGQEGEHTIYLWVVPWEKE